MTEQASQIINASLQKKSAARVAAVQCVYGRLLGDDNLSPQHQVERLKARLKNNKDEQKLILGVALEPNYPLVTALLEGTLQWQADIDKRIDKSLSKDWLRERMSPILIAILQCAIFELFFYKETAKHKVLIDEYSRLTARFFPDAEVNFINGVLKNLHTEFHGS